MDIAAGSGCEVFVALARTVLCVHVSVGDVMIPAGLNPSGNLHALKAVKANACVSEYDHRPVCSKNVVKRRLIREEEEGVTLPLPLPLPLLVLPPPPPLLL